MTERLYYRDPALVEFTGRILTTEQRDNRWITTLDRSAFYPTSGGQLFDTGLLNVISVVDVTESDNGDVLHISSLPIGKVGDTVTGKIDAARRMDNRQKHTAQHILSHCFIHLANQETVSVHLGEEYAAIELAVAEVSQELLDKAEMMANRIIVENVPIKILFIDSSQIDSVPLRKKPQRTGEIRVITIGDYDYSACGGTHCTQTGEVGLLKVICVEKMRGHSLVKFLAGRQAFEDYRKRFAVTNELSGLFTSHFETVVQNTQKLITQNKELRQQIGKLQEELLPIQVEQLTAKAEQIKEHLFVTAVYDDFDPKLLGQLAGMVSAKTKGATLLFSEERFVLTSDKATGLHAGNLVKELTQSLGIKGGGNETSAQAGGLSKNQQEAVIRKIRDALAAQ